MSKLTSTSTLLSRFTCHVCIDSLPHTTHNSLWQQTPLGSPPERQGPVPPHLCIVGWLYKQWKEALQHIICIHICCNKEHLQHICKTHLYKEFTLSTFSSCSLKMTCVQPRPSNTTQHTCTHRCVLTHTHTHTHTHTQMCTHTCTHRPLESSFPQHCHNEKLHR